MVCSYSMAFVSNFLSDRAFQLGASKFRGYFLSCIFTPGNALEHFGHARLMSESLIAVVGYAKSKSM